MQLRATRLTAIAHAVRNLFAGASLDLNFAKTGALDPRVTFARASGATRVNASGALEAVAIDGPRFDYDPVTLAPRGLLIEEQRTNLALNSGESLSGGTGGAVVADQITAPDGGLADLFREDSLSSEHYSGDRTITVTSGVTYCWSFFAKASSGSARSVYVRTALQGTAGVIFDVTTGTANVISSTALVSHGSQDAGNGWRRCWIVFTASSTGTAVFRQQLSNGVSPIYTGDGTSGLFIWGAQLEVGAFPTSYIPTTTAAATRAADVAVMTGANFSNWYRQDEGTLFAEFQRFYAAASYFPRVVSVGVAGSNSETIEFPYSSPNDQFAITAGGAAQGPINVVNGGTALNKLAGAYKLNDAAASINGAAAVTDNTSLVPTVSQMRIGDRQDGIRPFSGHIRRISYFPRRLSNSELEGITK